MSKPIVIYQIDHEIGEKVEGTDGAIVNSDKAMGFEGSRVISVPVNDSICYLPATDLGVRPIFIIVERGNV